MRQLTKLDDAYLIRYSLATKKFTVKADRSYPIQTRDRTVKGIYYLFTNYNLVIIFGDLYNT